MPTFVKPDKDATQKFMDYLAAHRVNVRLRISRGKDIDAACGQLANKNLAVFGNKLIHPDFLTHLIIPD